eukprot:CAMPEP_0119259978 /NCGR_PEP_ID=MMETSP1329-20130426/573_1 /TAXON_ID=114041 /ORGANISM="Genus nov. species nov., Strain RCC1024" /LENGTH=448 /DNA_ID=CAMNT_0007259391 /DNA_START=143 /DNA_END=1489 /DNA_ORIENTATION=+
MAMISRIFMGCAGMIVVGIAAVRNFVARPGLSAKSGKPPLQRQKAYRRLPGLGPREATTAAAQAPPHPGPAGGAPTRAEGGKPTPGAFGLDLLAALAETGENVFASPLSLATGLLMAEAGATDGSPAAAALAAAVGGLDVKVAGVSSANALYARSVIKESFAAALLDTFGAQAAPLPDSAKPINSWVAEKTAGLIDELVGDDIVKNPLTKALLLNAVYFKGSWASKFDKDASGPGTFHAPAGDVTATMMTQTGKFGVARPAGVGTVVALPYAADDLRMLLVLPEEEGLAGARKAAAALPAAWASARPTSVREAHRKVELVLPRFKIDSGANDLLPTLVERHPGLAAVRDEDGGFLKMAELPDLHVSNVVHRAVVAVDEEGTEAAAATAAVMMTRSIERPPPRIAFDRPFLFVVEHEPTGRALFVGQLATPPTDPDLPPPYPDVAKLGV